MWDVFQEINWLGLLSFGSFLICSLVEDSDMVLLAYLESYSISLGVGGDWMLGSNLIEADCPQNRTKP